MIAELLQNVNKPPPMTDSMVMYDASISLVNSRTAWLGSSYVCGSMYVLMPPGGVNNGIVTVATKQRVIPTVQRRYSQARPTLASVESA